MAVDSDRILIAQNARVYLAPVGTTAPAGPEATLDPAWREVGYFTPDSLQFNTDPSFEEVRSHQSNRPTRRWQTEDNATAQVDLQEWSGENFLAVFGGGTITEVAAVVGPPAIPKHYKYSPPAVGGRQSVAAIIEIIDEDKVYRLIIPKAEQGEGAEISLNKTSESTLPLRLTVLGNDFADDWYLLTEDEAFAPVP
ncbi:hypothetical protein ACFFMN_23020 [Planobispora siamensis]|uniref:Major tail protein n=1 Tax=Planobispora siamensis TaxID=936338 RepID=A0A8J3SN07_9ACTN|nr:hypothetical protein [Planobispora siamensis]GIH95440.1 hypothetical protein Psi01_60700 [Planobispora siamensis]